MGTEVRLGIQLSWLGTLSACMHTHARTHASKRTRMQRWQQERRLRSPKPGCADGSGDKSTFHAGLTT